MTDNVYEGAAHSRHLIHACLLPQESAGRVERRRRKKLELRRSQGEERKGGRECAGEALGTQEALNKCTLSSLEERENKRKRKMQTQAKGNEGWLRSHGEEVTGPAEQKEGDIHGKSQAKEGHPGRRPCREIMARTGSAQ